MVSPLPALGGSSRYEQQSPLQMPGDLSKGRVLKAPLHPVCVAECIGQANLVKSRLACCIPQEPTTCSLTTNTSTSGDPVKQLKHVRLWVTIKVPDDQGSITVINTITFSTEVERAAVLSAWHGVAALK